MEINWDFRGKLIKISIIVVTVLLIASMSLIVAYAENKVVIITEDVEKVEEVDNSLGISPTSKWMIDTAGSDDSYDGITIFTSYEISGKGISVSGRYIEEKVVIYINSNKDSYYLYNPPKGNFEHVERAYGEFTGDSVQITFELDHPMNYEYSYKNREINIKFTEIIPSEKTTVIIDAGHGGSSNGIKVGDATEQDIVLSVVKKVKELAEDKEYDVVLTREDNSGLSTADRLEIVELMGGDYYVGIHLSSDVDNTKTFGMYSVYNDGYYRNGIQNSKYADTILKRTCISTCNRGIAVVPAGEEEVILRALDIPATILYAGYMSNSDELMLLQSEEYVEKIAEGIVEALDEIIE